ncbi:hypothetical protein AQUCO_15200003v1 [Aquilegia coerulea]|uniref:Knottin scorpion toxin-like domain-containing protein n=1 Tax=Aquilegia coerulea TaxID=218851 RepID=A0A2G5C0U3_AQUCA|nr:hypothetical protein AQUCO_15200003v1 [Aquilegia coerulea]
MILASSEWYRYPRVVWDIVFVMLWITTNILFSWENEITGNAAPVCQGKCEDIPDCNNFCKNVAGYHGGRCEPPLYQFCCCY